MLLSSTSSASAIYPVSKQTSIDMSSGWVLSTTVSGGSDEPKLISFDVVTKNAAIPYVVFFEQAFFTLWLIVVPSWGLAVLLGLFFGYKFFSFGQQVTGSLAYSLTYLMYAVMITSGLFVHCLFLQECEPRSNSQVSHGGFQGLWSAICGVFLSSFWPIIIISVSFDDREPDRQAYSLNDREHFHDYHEPSKKR